MSFLAIKYINKQTLLFRGNNFLSEDDFFNICWEENAKKIRVDKALKYYTHRAESICLTVEKSLKTEQCASFLSNATWNTSEESMGKFSYSLGESFLFMG